MLVAQVIVDIDVPHLDRPFDYLVPQRLVGQVAVGSAVRVSWGGKRADAWVVALSDHTDHQGKLAPLLRVVSGVPLFTPQMLQTYRYLATRFAASLSQVLSLAIPPRRAGIEKEVLGARSKPAASLAHSAGVAAGRAGTDGRAGADGLPVTQTQSAGKPVADGAGTAPGEPDSAGRPIRQVQQMVPGLGSDQVIAAVAAAHAAGTPVAVTLPTFAAAQRAAAQVREALPDLRIGLLAADQPATERYRTYLMALLGDIDVVIGTRTAAWTPFPRPSLVITWEDDNDLLRERRHPRLDVLDIALARARFEGYGLLAASYSRSLKAQLLAESGWAASVVPTRAELRAAAPRVQFVSEENFEREGLAVVGKFPGEAFATSRRGLARGPVLVMVPGPARTVTTESGSYEVGPERLARELGRAFGGTKVIVSASSSQIRRDIGGDPALVVATPGAEPKTPGGYAAIVVVDGESVARADRLDAGMVALRRWMAAFTLARPQAPVLVLGDVPSDVQRALVMWDPVTYAAQTLRAREELAFYPAAWVVAVDGDSRAVSEVVSKTEAFAAAAEPGGDQPLELTVMGTVDIPEDQPAEEAPAPDSQPDPDLLDPALFDFAEVAPPAAPRRVRTLLSCPLPQAMTLMEHLGGQQRTRSLERLPAVQTTVNPPGLFD